jgi:hypothetical protein
MGRGLVVPGLGVVPRLGVNKLYIFAIEKKAQRKREKCSI